LLLLTVAVARVVSPAGVLGVRIDRRTLRDGAAGVRLTPGVVRRGERRPGYERDREDERLQP
jgi:hypothetical protein